MNGYWVGPYAAGGSGIFGGFIDYMNMINARDGGINGVKLTYEKCETEYNNARIDHVHEVDESSEDAGAAGCVGADPVTVHRDELLVLRIGRACDGERRGPQECGASDFSQHWNPPLDGNLPVSTGYRNEQPRLL